MSKFLVEAGMTGSADPRRLQSLSIVGVVPVEGPSLPQVHVADGANRGLLDAPIMDGLLQRPTGTSLLRVAALLLLQLGLRFRPVLLAPSLRLLDIHRSMLGILFGPRHRHAVMVTLGNS